MNEQAKLIHRLIQSTDMLAAIDAAGSFTGAAELLGVEQSAISHRVRTLETTLGARLFDRTTRKLQSTEVGEIVCACAIRTSEAWLEVLGQIEDLQRRPAFRLSVPSSVAMKWLVPALGRAGDHGLELAIDVEDRLVDLRASAARAAIRYGPGPYPGYHTELLSRSDMVPVARPGLHRGRFPSGSGQGASLLADTAGETDGTGFSWNAYGNGLEPSTSFPEPTQRFNRADLMLQAAISGVGVALGRSLLIEGDLNAGFLEVIGPKVPAASRYWLVTTPETASTEGYQLLKSWLMAEVSRAAEILAEHVPEATSG